VHNLPLLLTSSTEDIRKFVTIYNTMTCCYPPNSTVYIRTSIGGVRSMGLKEFIMIFTHKYGIEQRIVSCLKKKYQSSVLGSHVFLY
jgi:hypothetical protein